MYKNNIILDNSNTNNIIDYKKRIFSSDLECEMILSYVNLTRELVNEKKSQKDEYIETIKAINVNNSANDTIRQNYGFIFHYPLLNNTINNPIVREYADNRGELLGENELNYNYNYNNRSVITESDNRSYSNKRRRSDVDSYTSRSIDDTISIVSRSNYQKRKSFAYYDEKVLFYINRKNVQFNLY